MVLGVSLGVPRCREQAPAPGRIERRNRRLSSPARREARTATLRRDQGAQPGEAVRRHHSPVDQLPQRVLHLGSQHAGAFDEIHEKTGAGLEQMRVHPARGATENHTPDIRDRSEPSPVRDVAPLNERDRRVPNRPILPLALGRRQGQTHPREASGGAQGIQHARCVVADARRQHVRLPGRRRHGEAFELLEGAGRRFLTFPRVGQSLPMHQEAHEVCNADRLYQAAQVLDGVAVDARQQTSLTPLLAAPRKIAKPPANDETLAFEREERRRHLPRLDAERSRQRFRGDRAETFQTAAHDLSERVAAIPGHVAGRQCRYLRIGDGAGKQCAKLREALRGHPQGLAGCEAQTRGASVLGQQREQAAPAGRSVATFPTVDLVIGEEAEDHQRIVQLVGVTHVGPRLGAHPLDGARVEASELGSICRLHEAA